MTESDSSQQAHNALSELEAIAGYISNEDIREKEQDIRTKFQRANVGTRHGAGIAIDDATEFRILRATRYAYRKRAEARLEILAEPGFARTMGELIEGMGEIRHLFVLSGVDLTAEGKLPERLEQRLIEKRDAALRHLRQT